MAPSLAHGQQGHLSIEVEARILRHEQGEHHEMRIRSIVNRIIADGIVTRTERAELVHAVAEDPELTEEERLEVGRLVELIRNGDVRLVDDETPADA